jgi:pyruvate dehydrogenase E1 component
MRWGFDYMQRDGEGDPDDTWLRDETGGSVYLRLSTRSIEQPQRMMTPELEQGIVDGAYWLRKPGPNCLGGDRLYRRASRRRRSRRRDCSARPARCRPARDHLGRPAQCRLDRRRDPPRQRGNRSIEPYRAPAQPLPRDCGIVTVLDGHPATLGWLGSVCGHRRRRWASSISARPAPSPTSIATTAANAIVHARKLRLRAGRCAISRRCRNRRQAW